MPLPSAALNILVTNDDGLTANSKALQTALLAAGHDVVLSMPCQNQSGKGAAVNFLSPVTPLAKACAGNAAAAGAPGAGTVAGLSNAYYIDGTPVMAVMYGLDVAAPQRWKRAPELVISGPNEGQHLGAIVISSGTVSNAQYALARGIPAIAVSADANTTKNDALAAEVADLTAGLVQKLEKQAKGKALLPKGLALNMNIPLFEAGRSAQLPWAATRFGDFDSLSMKFVPDLGADPVAASLDLGSVHLPGVTVVSHAAGEATRQTDPNSEALKSLNGQITVTPMQFGYAAGTAGKQFGGKLKGLLKAK